MTDIEWRALVRADAPALTELSRELAETAGAHSDATVEQTLEEFDAAGWNAATDGLAALGPDGALLGMAYVITAPPGGYLARGFGGVAQAARKQGIGQRLVDWTVQRATQMHAESGATEPWQLNLGVTNDEDDAVQLLRDNGFEPVRYWFEMQRPVDGPVVPAVLPAGLRIRPYSTADDRAFYDTHMEVFVDHWGFQVRPYDQWHNRVTSSAFRPGLTFFAVDADDRIAGYLSTRAGADPARAEMAIIGTRREWRGKGVASALIAHALDAYPGAGIEVATLGVDSNNPTGALSVYERMGFEIETRFTSYTITLG